MSSLEQRFVELEKKLYTAESLAANLTGYLEGFSSQLDSVKNREVLNHLIEVHKRSPLASSEEWINRWTDQLNKLNKVEKNNG